MISSGHARQAADEIRIGKINRRTKPTRERAKRQIRVIDIEAIVNDGYMDTLTIGDVPGAVVRNALVMPLLGIIRISRNVPSRLLKYLSQQ